jgi:DNA-binding transcriptional MerR regulator
MYGKTVTLFDQDIVPEDIRKSQQVAPPPVQEAEDKKSSMEAFLSSNYFNVGGDMPALDELLDIFEPPAATEGSEIVLDETPYPADVTPLAVPVASNTELQEELTEALVSGEPEITIAVQPFPKDPSINKSTNNAAVTKTPVAEPAAMASLPEDWTGEKQYYSIGEVAELFNVKTSNIRYWTTEFDIKVRTNRKGDRLYAPEQINELRTIYGLVKEQGFKLSGARAKLKQKKSKPLDAEELKKTLQQLRGTLLKIKKAIDTQ